jgi:hypothetical protein
MTDLKEMKYLERVIKEVMRLHPIAPMIGRKLAEDVEIGKQSTSSHCVCLNLFVGNSTAVSAIALTSHLQVFMFQVVTRSPQA